MGHTEVRHTASSNSLPIALMRAPTLDVGTAATTALHYGQKCAEVRARDAEYHARGHQARATHHIREGAHELVPQRWLEELDRAGDSLAGLGG